MSMPVTPKHVKLNQDQFLPSISIRMAAKESKFDGNQTFSIELPNTFSGLKRRDVKISPMVMKTPKVAEKFQIYSKHDLQISKLRAIH